MRASYAALLILLLGGCPSPGGSADGGPQVEVLEPAVRDGATPGARYTLGEVKVETVDGRHRLLARVSASWDRPMEFDGLAAKGQDVVLQQSEVRLLGFEPAVRMVEQPPVGVNPPGALIVPSEGSRRVAWDLAFELPGPLPPKARLWLTDDTGAVVLPLQGGWTTDDGTAAVAVEPVDLAGRRVVAKGALRWDGGQDAPPPGGRPFLLPDGVVAATLTLDGFAPVEVDASGDAPVVRPVVLPDTDAARVEAAFAEALDGLFETSLEHDLTTLAEKLGEPQAIAAWVREHVAVIGTAGLQRSPAAVLRLGAGGPVDRANLVIELLGRIGKGSEIVCGDLGPEAVKALYARTVAVPEPPPALAKVFADGVPATAALAGTLASSMAAIPERPLGAQDTYRLTPEWCWVALRKVDDQTPPEMLDLRPAPWDRTPLPFAWRSSDRLATEVWSLDLRLTALVRTPTGVQDVLLAHQSAPVAVLDERAILVDLRPGHAEGTMLGGLTWFDGDDARTALGDEASARDVEAVSLTIAWRDPSDIATRATTLELWQTDHGEPVPTMRVLLAPDPGMADVTKLAGHLAEATGGRSPVPGGHALAVRHALYGRLRLGLSGGVITEAPTMVATIATLDGDGTVGWRMEAFPAQPPVSMGGPTDVVTAARAAAADAVARALVLGTPLPAAPASWIRSHDDPTPRPSVPRPLQIAIARSLGTVFVGASSVTPPEVASLWFLDPVTGGVAWYQGMPVARTPDVPPVELPVSGDPRWPFVRWEASLRCAEAMRWSTWTGRPVPPSCPKPAL